MNKLSSPLTLLLLFVLALPALALDIPLRYERYPEPTEVMPEESGFCPYGMHGLEKLRKLPPGDWQLPKLLSKQPVYAMVALGDRKHLFILDQKNVSTTFYDRLYFDANANGDLTDDAPIDGEIYSDMYTTQCMFPSVESEILLEGVSIPYSFRPSCRHYSFNGTKEVVQSWETALISLRINCAYYADFDLDGKTYHLVLGDRNANGRFSDRLLIDDFDTDAYRALGDELFLSRAGKVSWYDAQKLGNLLIVEDKVFEVAVSTAKKTMTLTPITEGLTSLKLAAATERFTLYNNKTQRGVTAFQPGSALMLPEGDYYLFDYQMMRKDAQGDLWRLNARMTGKGEAATVAKGSPASLTFGEPFIPTVTGQPAKEASVAQLTFKAIGAGGEEVSDLARIAGNKSKIPLSARDLSRPREPSYKVARPDGELATQGSFEYG